MNRPYGVYLAGREISDHETFTEALAAFGKVAHLNGANMRNSERSDVDFDGLTEAEREAVDVASDTRSRLSKWGDR